MDSVLLLLSASHLVIQVVLAWYLIVKLPKQQKTVVEYREATGGQIISTPSGVFVNSDKRDPVINDDEALHDREH